MTRGLKYSDELFTWGRDDAPDDTSDLLGIDELEEREHRVARLQVPNSNRLLVGNVERVGKDAEVRGERGRRSRGRLSRGEEPGTNPICSSQFLQAHASRNVDRHSCRFSAEERHDLRGVRERNAAEATQEESKLL